MRSSAPRGRTRCSVTGHADKADRLLIKPTAGARTVSPCTLGRFIAKTHKTRSDARRVTKRGDDTTLATAPDGPTRRLSQTPESPGSASRAWRTLEGVETNLVELDRGGGCQRFQGPRSSPRHPCASPPHCRTRSRRAFRPRRDRRGGGTSRLPVLPNGQSDARHLLTACQSGVSRCRRLYRTQESAQASESPSGTG